MSFGLPLTTWSGPATDQFNQQKYNEDRWLQQYYSTISMTVDNRVNAELVEAEAVTADIPETTIS